MNKSSVDKPDRTVKPPHKTGKVSLRAARKAVKEASESHSKGDL